jgi:NDP-sugar pyrophosphorylase family protein
MIRGAVRRLPETQREVIALAYWGGLSASEIARDCGVPLGTVKSRMRAGPATAADRARRRARSRARVTVGSGVIAALRPSDRAPGLLVGPDVEIADDAEIGGHVVVHAGVRVGAGCLVQDGATLGKPPLRVPRFALSGARAAAHADRVAGLRSGAGAVVCAGAQVGEEAVIGDHVLLREGCTIGPSCVLGHGVAVGFDVPVGARSRIRNNTVLAPASIVEADVFLGVGVITTDHKRDGSMTPGTASRCAARCCVAAAASAAASSCCRASRSGRRRSSAPAPS